MNYSEKLRKTFNDLKTENKNCDVILKSIVQPSVYPFKKDETNHILVLWTIREVGEDYVVADIDMGHERSAEEIQEGESLNDLQIVSIIPFTEILRVNYLMNSKTQTLYVCDY